MIVSVLQTTDPRMSYAKEALDSMGYTTHFSDWEALPKDGSPLLLPTPLTKHGVCFHGTHQTIPQKIEGHPILIAGSIPDSLRLLWEEGGHRVYDLMDTPRFVKENARLTAEAAVCLALPHCQSSPGDLSFGILGSGRIATYLTKVLVGLGACVTVFGRSAAGRHALASLGATALPIPAPDQSLPACSVLFNTIPARVLSSYHMESLSHTQVIELASGTDNLPPKKDNTLPHLIWGGLPGKVFPRSSGKLIAEATHAILSQG